MPLFAHFCFVVFIHRDGLHNEFVVAVRVAALVLELALTGTHKVAAQLRLVVDAEVLNVLEHLLARSEVHLFLLACCFGTGHGQHRLVYS